MQSRCSAVPGPAPAPRHRTSSDYPERVPGPSGDRGTNSTCFWNAHSHVAPHVVFQLDVVRTELSGVVDNFAKGLIEMKSGGRLTRVGIPHARHRFGFDAKCASMIEGVAFWITEGLVECIAQHRCRSHCWSGDCWGKKATPLLTHAFCIVVPRLVSHFAKLCSQSGCLATSTRWIQTLMGLAAVDAMLVAGWTSQSSSGRCVTRIRSRSPSCSRPSARRRSRPGPLRLSHRGGLADGWQGSRCFLRGTWEIARSEDAGTGRKCRRLEHMRMPQIRRAQEGLRSRGASA